MKRRGFLKEVVRYSAVFATGAVPYLLSYLLAPSLKAEAKTRIPLPGALANIEEFNQACIRCGLCAEVCPPKCIQFHGYDGKLGLNTPYINPEEKSCILCGKCMDVCPTDALNVTAIPEVKMGIAQIDRAACYPWVDKGICGACVSACPLHAKAIKFDFGNIYRPVIQKGCVGCGQCVEACPHPSLPIRIVAPTRGTIATHKVSAADSATLPF